MSDVGCKRTTKKYSPLDLTRIPPYPRIRTLHNLVGRLDREEKVGLDHRFRVKARGVVG